MNTNLLDLNTRSLCVILLKILLITFFYIQSPSINSQNKKLDSLQHVLLQEDLPDSNRIKISLDIVSQIYYRDFPSSIKILKDIDGLVASSSIQNKFQQKYLLGSVYSQMNKMDTAEVLLHEAMSLVDPKKFPREYAIAQSGLGMVEESRGNLNEAIQLYNEAAPLFLEEQDSFKYAATLNNLGIAYELQAHYTAALESYLIALEIFESLSAERGISAISKNIGVIKQKQQSTDEALFYYKKAFRQSNKIGNKRSEAGNLNAIGAIFMDMDQLDSAAHYLNLSSEIREEVKDELGISVSSNNLGKLYRLRNDCMQGIQYNERALQYAKKIGAVKPTIFALLELGYCHLNLSQISKARSYLTEALSLADRMGEVSLQYKVENALYDLYKNSSHTQALYHYENAMTYRDSMFNREKTEELKTIELNYEFDKERFLSDQKIRDLVLEDEIKSIKLQNRNYTIFLLLSILLGTLLLSYLFWNNYKKSKALTAKENQLQKQKIEQLEKERKIMAMASMIEGQEAERARIAQDLHDGLGGLLSSVKLRLSNIDQQVKEIESYHVYERTSEIVDEACDEVRRISHNLLPGALRLEGLKSAVEHLSQELSEVHGIDVKTEIFGFEEMKDDTNSIFIFRIIQEATNNIIKYAKASHVLIQLYESKEQFQLVIEDDGVGFDTTKETNGLGLRSMASRVDFLKGEIDINSVIDEGTTISISLPKVKL